MGGHSTIKCIHVLSDITTEALLGLDFLESQQSSVNAGKKTLAFSESGTEVLLQKGDDADTINSIDNNLPLHLKYTVSVLPMSELEVLAVVGIQHLGGTWLVEGEQQPTSCDGGVRNCDSQS